MPDYDDAESPIGEREAPSRSRTHATGPIGKAWAWFSAQPATTKVIVIGVIVVLGVVVWMALRKTNPVQTTGEETTGSFKDNRGSLPKIPGENGPTGIATFPGQPIPLGGGYQPGPQPVEGGPGQSGPTGINQPILSVPVSRWNVTPGGVSNPYANYNINNAGHRQGIAVTGSLN